MDHNSKLIGIISDTHGLVRPQALEALAGTDMILHAGDIGNQQVLDTLKDIAPVVAVRGNNDKGDWAQTLPDWEVVDVGSVSIYMLHDVKEIDISPSGAGFHVVVSGHSHKPSVEDHRGVRVPKLCHRSCFAQKTIGDVGIAGTLALDDFDCDGPFEIEMRGKVDSSHAAGPDFTFYPESASDKSGDIHI